MASFDCVVRNGTVVTASDTVACDIGIVDGVVVALGRDLPAGRREIDASGRLVLPGGVDTHTHIEEPAKGPARNADSFDTASASAAAGGTTTVICFARQPRGGTLADKVAAYHELAKASRVDYSFHLILTDPTPELLERELPPLVEAGHRSLKIFLTYEGAKVTDAEALRVLAAARRLGALVCVHAEHNDLIEFYRDALLAAGLTAPKYHGWVKPMVVERECTHRIIAMAEALDTPIQVFHVSGAESAEEVARGQARGLKVWAETCPQYLTLTTADMDRPGFEGAKFIFSPAARTTADQEALWAAIRAGVIGNVSSDHAPSRYEGPDGKKAHGEDAPFTKVPNGLPGLATRLPVLFSEGVSKGRIDLQTFVAITATNPAKLFGLHPRKGTIAVGADADLTIWDPEKEVTITNSLLHHGSDYTPYEGMAVKGWPVTTLVRGTVVCDGGEIATAPGGGRFLARDPYPLIAPRGVFPGPFNPVDGVPA
ncbi:dihydropyrimidinase [Pseudoroseomonas sp. WGS1072]|uniref:dihydropyrimidinase n=1 Tax=Roseomonas sp. WGS1072 TaxID=3366816 RepID=UPI003BF03E11